MTATLTKYRDKITGAVYRGVLKPLFFRNDPETVHDALTRVGVALGKTEIGRDLTSVMFGYQDPMLRQEVLGIAFENPIGLSAGFDKNVQLTDILPEVGFGFAEVGSITGEKCEGNPKPRLWRLPKSKGLVVYYGLKNDGCEAIAKRLQGTTFKIPIGMSVAMTNCAENAEDIDKGIADFVKAFTVMEPLATYLTVNISCPNTSGGQPFVDPGRLERLLAKIDMVPTTKPIFIKLSPDLVRQDLDAILDAAKRHRIHGIVCTNLTKKRDNPNIHDASVPEKGGISGMVVQELADDVLAYIYKREKKRFVLMGSGGVFTAEDAYRKIRLGASLIQMITGMVFEGPQVIGEINRGLAELLRRDGFKTIADAVGVDAR